MCKINKGQYNKNVTLYLVLYVYYISKKNNNIVTKNALFVQIKYYFENLSLCNTIQ